MENETDGAPAPAFSGQQAFLRDAKIPAFVGVAGHRSLDPLQVDELKAMTRAGLIALGAAFPNTPLIICCQLAEGADRLVAQVAMDMSQAGELDVSLLQLRPLPEKDFQSTFTSGQRAASIAEYEKLRTRVSAGCVDFFEGAVEEDDQERHFQAASRWLTTHCSVLIALWDGEPEAGIGGTAETVREMLEGAHVHAQGADVHGGAVLRIPVTPGGNPRPENEAVWCVKGMGAREESCEFSGERLREVLRDLRSIALYNGDVEHCSQGSLAIAKKSAAKIPSDASSNPFARHVAARFGMADALSREAQAGFFRVTVQLSGFALLGAISFSLVGGAVEFDSPIVLPLLSAFYLGVLAYAWTVYRRAMMAGFRNNYLERRGLAEGLRVQLGWDALGVSEDASEHYLLTSIGCLDWVRRAIGNCAVQLGSEASTSKHRNIKPAPAEFDWAMKWWVAEEREFFEVRARTFEVNCAAIKKWERYAWRVGLVAISLSMFLYSFADCRDWITDERCDLSAAVGVLSFALAGTLGKFEENRGFEMQAGIYRRLLAVFTGHAELLAVNFKAGDQEAVIRSAQTIGRAALTENGIWLGSQISRKLESPSG